MKAKIVSFRRGRHRQTTNQMILAVEGVVSKDDAAKYVGKKVTWTSPAGKALTGSVTATHGNSGCLRAHFDTGMPGQALSTDVSLE